MQNYAVSAIQAAMHGQKTFCKFLSANDTGLTGAIKQVFMSQSLLFLSCLTNQVKEGPVKTDGSILLGRMIIKRPQDFSTMVKGRAMNIASQILEEDFLFFAQIIQVHCLSL